MRFTDRTFFIIEELAQVISAEMPLRSLIVIDDTGRKGLLVCLALEDLLFKRTCSNEAVDEAFLLLTISPYSRQSLLISSRIPVWYR